MYICIYREREKERDFLFGNLICLNYQVLDYIVLYDDFICEILLFFVSM